MVPEFQEGGSGACLPLREVSSKSPQSRKKHLTCTLLGRAVNTNDESSLGECSKHPLLSQGSSTPSGSLKLSSPGHQLSTKAGLLDPPSIRASIAAWFCYLTAEHTPWSVSLCDTSFFSLLSLCAFFCLCPAPLPSTPLPGPSDSCPVSTPRLLSGSL